MFAARDQENLVNTHQTFAASKPLNQTTRNAAPKTPAPANKFSKTPLRVPLNDENAPAGFGGGKSALQTKGKGNENLMTGGKKGVAFNKSALATPIGQTARAPLGNKTTNAKTKVFQTPAGPAAEKDSSKKAKPSSARPNRAKIQHPQSVKLEIHGDNEGPLEERDIEYMPPKPKDLPYISEDFPDGCLNYDMLKGGNLTKGWQEYYFSPVDENGVSLAQKREDEADAKAAKQTDDRILREMEELDWSVGDCPGLPSVVKKTIEEPKPKPAAPAQAKTTLPGRAPSTINSRIAASLLSTAPKATAARPALSAVSAGASKPKSRFPFLSGGKKPQPAPANIPNTRFVVAAAASRSTMGYNKGRSASTVVHEKSKPPPRSTTALSFTSTASDKPQASGAHAEHKATNFDEEDMKKLRFLSAFDSDEEEAETGLKDGLPDCLRNSDDDEDEFVLTLGN